MSTQSEIAVMLWTSITYKYIFLNIYMDIFAVHLYNLSCQLKRRVHFRRQLKSVVFRSCLFSSLSIYVT